MSRQETEMHSLPSLPHFLPLFISILRFSPIIQLTGLWGNDTRSHSESAAVNAFWCYEGKANMFRPIRCIFVRNFVQPKI